MRSSRMKSETRAARKRGRLARALALCFLVMTMVVVGGAAAPAAPDQQGVTRTTCRADNVYIYKYPTTQSERRHRLGRGASFRVYHYVDGTWAFGVHNASGVSGYVLREKLCS